MKHLKSFKESIKKYDPYDYGYIDTKDISKQLGKEGYVFFFMLPLEGEPPILNKYISSKNDDKNIYELRKKGPLTVDKIKRGICDEPYISCHSIIQSKKAAVEDWKKVLEEKLKEYDIKSMPYDYYLRDKEEIHDKKKHRVFTNNTFIQSAIMWCNGFIKKVEYYSETSNN